MFNQKAMDKECWQMEDIVTGDRIMNFVEFDRKFPNCINWLDYNGICAAFPSHCKFFIKSDNLIDSRKPMYQLLEDAKPTRHIYEMLISKDTAIGKYWHRWRGEDIDSWKFPNLRVLFTFPIQIQFCPRQFNLLASGIIQKRIYMAQFHRNSTAPIANS